MTRTRTIVWTAGVLATLAGLTGWGCQSGQTSSRPAAGAVAAPIQPSGKLEYPKTAKGDTVDDYFGTKVADPYRWLEDDNAENTKAWVQAQNKVTFAYLNAIPERSSIHEKLRNLWNYEKFGIPGKEGGKYFWSHNTGLQNQSVLFVGDSPSGNGKTLLDPNEWAKDGTAALGPTDITDDGGKIAYSIQEKGSDWAYIKVRDINTGKDLAEKVEWVKFSGPAWTKDGAGFFYSRYDKPKEGDALKGANYWQKVYYHKAGTAQDADTLVYDRPDKKEWGMGAAVTEDGNYIILSLSQGTDPKNRLYYRDLKANPLGKDFGGADGQIRAIEEKIKAAIEEAGKDGKPDITGLESQRAQLLKQNAGGRNGFVELLNDFDASYDFVGNDGPTLFFKTDLSAPKSRVIAINVNHPERAAWKEIIPQRDETLQGVSFVGDMFLCSYLKDARTVVHVHDMTGKLVRDVDLPGLGTAGGFGGKRKDTETFYSFTSYTTPPSIYKYDIKTGKSTLHKAPKVAFDGSKYETRQVFYSSKDGTKIPMFITAKKGLKLDGTNPTLLYAYGGFNIPMTPGFSPRVATWLDMGGVYCVANLRGGGEYGEEWHQGGTKLKKQNVFDDFIAAGEYLIREKYTSTPKLAIHGGSNGGLLIGACVNQRPDLWGAALPAVGVMDMLRFHKFTIGWAWKSDYGSSEDSPEMFAALSKFSPVHTLKPGTCYPPTLITTGDHDDRVVPAHSFKYAAGIQAAQGCDKPVLIRIDTSAGHGGGKPTEKQIEEAADQWAFLVKSLGMKVDLR